MLSRIVWESNRTFTWDRGEEPQSLSSAWVSECEPLSMSFTGDVVKKTIHNPCPLPPAIVKGRRFLFLYLGD